MGNSACEITVGLKKYWVVKMVHKAAFRIVDLDGDVVAEVKKKKKKKISIINPHNVNFYYKILIFVYIYR